MEKYLLTRKEAAERYSISTRRLDDIYRRNRDFPITRVGRKVLIYRQEADEWFAQFKHDVIME